MSLFRFFACVVSLAGTALLFGCGQEDAALAGVSLDAHRTLGEPLTVGNLTVWPVHTDQPLDIGSFQTLAEAQEKGVAVVREVGGDPQSVNVRSGDDDIALEEHRGQGGNDAGQVLIESDGAVVNTLVIENKGDRPILVCAGTIVDGGKQDRQIGQDFVIEAGTTVDVDAFCVEQGRWSTEESTINAGEFVTFGAIAPKGVRVGGQYLKDQDEVWAKVSVNLQRCSVDPKTGTLLANVQKADVEVTRRRADVEREIEAHFAKLARGKNPPVGFAYAVNGKPVTVRAFAHSRILEGQLPAFQKAMVLEADVARAEAAEGFEPATAASVVALVRQLNAAKEELVATGAANDNGYRKGAVGYNARCYLRQSGSKRVTVSEDWTAK